MTEFIILTDILCFITIVMILLFWGLVSRHERLIKKVVKEQEEINNKQAGSGKCSTCGYKWGDVISKKSGIANIQCPHCGAITNV